MPLLLHHVPLCLDQCLAQSNRLANKCSLGTHYVPGPCWALAESSGQKRHSSDLERLPQSLEPCKCVLNDYKTEAVSHGTGLRLQL